MSGWLGNSRIVRAALCLGLLGASCQSIGAQPMLTYNRQAQPTKPPTLTRQDQPSGVLPATFQDKSPASSAPAVDNQRLLAPPSRAKITPPNSASSEPSRRGPKFTLPKIESLTTAGSGLAIVVGLFLVCMWLLRRSGPKPTSPLPAEAVRVLGRVPLAARNFAHLLQVGNKLVLVAITPEGASPITEVTDPAEVQRLLGLCLSNHNQSTTAEFQHVLEKISKEPARGFLGNEAAASHASQGR